MTIHPKVTIDSSAKDSAEAYTQNSRAKSAVPTSSQVRLRWADQALATTAPSRSMPASTVAMPASRTGVGHEVGVAQAGQSMPANKVTLIGPPLENGSLAATLVPGARGAHRADALPGRDDPLFPFPGRGAGVALPWAHPSRANPREAGGIEVPAA